MIYVEDFNYPAIMDPLKCVSILDSKFFAKKWNINGNDSWDKEIPTLKWQRISILLIKIIIFILINLETWSNFGKWKLLNYNI